MKRAILSSVLLAGLLGFSSTARADHRWSWGFGVGVGFGGGHFQGSYFQGNYHRRALPRQYVHVHARAPVYTQVWVPPVYATVFAGYNQCGAPIYRSVVTCNGYYRTVRSGYHCGTCGEVCY